MKAQPTARGQAHVAHPLFADDRGGSVGTGDVLNLHDQLGGLVR